jgi:hypothetical protein
MYKRDPVDGSSTRALTRRHVIGVQALYYGVTGLWPFVHLRSFLAITGPKNDIWLVKTVAALLGVIASFLGLTAVRRQDDDATLLLSAGSAFVLAGVDVVYVARRRVSQVYLYDAVAQVLVLVGLGASNPQR